MDALAREPARLSLTPIDEHHAALDRIRGLTAELAQLRKGLAHPQRLTGGLEHGTLSATAALLAYLPTQAVGLHEGFWAAITAIGVVQIEFGATRSTARDQFTGAAVGGLVGVLVDLAAGHTVASYAASVVVAITACWLLNVLTAARLAGVTATIIMLVPHQGSALSIMVARVGEVAWGVLVGVCVVWLFSRVTRGRSKAQGAGAAPVATGRSARPPHSVHDPS